MRALHLIIAAVLALLSFDSAAAIACDWTHPGANRYTGMQSAAVMSYAEIPLPVRMVLASRVAAHAGYTDVVTIHRDGIVSERDGSDYHADLAGMHFGAGQRCEKVDRSRWSDGHEEKALVYCFAGHCIAIPSVCGNVSRLVAAARAPDGRASAGGASVIVAPSYRDALVRTVDEPGTLEMVLLGAAVIAVSLYTSRRR